MGILAFVMKYTFIALSLIFSTLLQPVRGMQQPLFEDVSSTTYFNSNLAPHPCFNSPTFRVKPMAGAWTDINNDGWPDLFFHQWFRNSACTTDSRGKLFENQLIGGSSDRTLVEVPGGYGLESTLPTCMVSGQKLYGAHFADFDDDGWVDVATSPRNPVFSNACFETQIFTRSPLGLTFTNQAASLCIGSSCMNIVGEGESFVWGDFDQNGRLDLLLTYYETSLATGNRLFLQTGISEFTELSPTNSGLPLGTINGAYPRPEGAQAVDVNDDGLLDLYLQDAVFLRTIAGPNMFSGTRLLATGTGGMDEGANFADFDLDGDMDLLVCYNLSTLSPRIFVNGTSSANATGEFAEQNFSGFEPDQVTHQGSAVVDWDNDGDMDIVLSRNAAPLLLPPTFSKSSHYEYWINQSRGDIWDPNKVFFSVLKHPTGPPKFGGIIKGFLANANAPHTGPAWADFDRDGDLDFVDSRYRLWRNNLYGPETVANEKEYLMIHPTNNLGHETEFGTRVRIYDSASGELLAHNFVSSCAGYLQQNEYPLLMGGIAWDSTVDIEVLFPNQDPNGNPGARVVDKNVNSILGAFNPSQYFSANQYRRLEIRRDGTVL